MIECTVVVGFVSKEEEEEEQRERQKCPEIKFEMKIWTRKEPEWKTTQFFQLPSFIKDIVLFTQMFLSKNICHENCKKYKNKIIPFKEHTFQNTISAFRLVMHKLKTVIAMSRGHCCPFFTGKDFLFFHLSEIRVYKLDRLSRWTSMQQARQHQRYLV